MIGATGEASAIFEPGVVLPLVHRWAPELGQTSALWGDAAVFGVAGARDAL